MRVCVRVCAGVLLADLVSMVHNTCCNRVCVCVCVSALVFLAGLFVLENDPSGAGALLRDAVHLRRAAADYLVFGTLLRPPTPTVPIELMTRCGNRGTVETYPCCPTPVVL